MQELTRIYLEVVDGHPFTLEVFKGLLLEDSGDTGAVPMKVSGSPHVHQLWAVSLEQFFVLEAQKGAKGLKYRIYTRLTASRPRRNRELEIPAHFRVAKAVQEDLEENEKITNPRVRGLLCLLP